jgi:CRP/FNR family cyclic AMP-dependent transcriptional regulator
MPLKSRFEAPADLVAALRQQKLIMGDSALAEALAAEGDLVAFPAGRNIITQGEADRDVHFLLAGRAQIIINGVRLYHRQAGVSLGEMSAVNASISRTATLEASEPAVSWKVNHTRFGAVADAHPSLWRALAQDIAGRLEQRNSLINRSNFMPKVFMICSAEALPIAKAIRVGLEHDASVTIWSDDMIFPAGGYPIEALEQEVNDSDFAIALTEPDDLVLSRDRLSTTPRDNVIFELGFFMARLGRRRTLLLTPRREEVKLPSDFKGLTPLPYSIGPTPRELSVALGPTIDRISAVIADRGVRASLIDPR